MKTVNFKNAIFLLALVIILALNWSCKNSHKEETSNNVKFQTFIHKLKIINLPFEYRAYTEENYLVDEKLNTDFIAYNKDTFQCANVIGLLNDTTDFYAIVWLIAAGHSLPIVSTFDKSGKLISNIHLFNIKETGLNCEFNSMSYSYLDKDYNIQLIDTITESKCEADNIQIRKYYVSKMIGKINKNGVVKYGKPLNFNLDIKDALKKMG